MQLSPWIQAARPMAQANIAIPLGFGQALAFSLTGHFSLSVCAAVFVFGVFDQLYIVFANDVADYVSDKENVFYNRFSGGSRVLVDGRLQPAELMRAAIASAVLMMGVCATLAFTVPSPWLLGLGGIALLLLWLYSFAPARLAYRGHGEVLQGLGIGVVLPLFGYLAQGGRLGQFPVVVGFASFLMGYAGNITTALPDRPSDEKTAKRSYPVRRGERSARRESLLLLATAVGILVATSPFSVPWRAGVGLPVGALLLWNLLAQDSDSATRKGCELFVLRSGAACSWAWVVGAMGFVSARF